MKKEDEKCVEVIAVKEVMGNELSIYGSFDEPLFLAKDVAEWIDYAKTGKGAYNVSMMLDLVDEDEKLVSQTLVSGQKRQVWFLTEDGLYELLMQSQKPIAKTFKKEVKKVLRNLRVNGVVVTPKFAMASPEEQAVSFQKALDSAVHHAIEIAEAHFQPQIEELNRQKAWIADKQTATAMQTASALTRKTKRLEREIAYKETELDDLQDELVQTKIMAQKYIDWKGKVGRPPKGYVRPDSDNTVFLF